jgi:phosphoribosylaminoimidazolecarboxamide formyltransferase/IMP cyclohydrolase
MPAPVTQALLSVSDKAGLVEFARGLTRLGVALLSTGGTARALSDAGIKVTEVGDYTGFPEMLDGRVKTLHPKVHAGILARRVFRRTRQHEIRDPNHRARRRELVPISRDGGEEGCTLDDAIENIDIGGPTMVRAAAKNWQHVGVVVDPADYGTPSPARDERPGAFDGHAVRARAKGVLTYVYDGAISGADGARRGSASKFRTDSTSGVAQDLLRRGPHQQAAFYRDEMPVPGSIATYRQLQGKELSYNNLADSDAAPGMRSRRRRHRPRRVRGRQARESRGAAIDTPLGLTRHSRPIRWRRSAASSRSSAGRRDARSGGGRFSKC